jgi:hypothetical protein
MKLGLVRQVSTATDQFGREPRFGQKVFVPDPWEEAPDRHEQCLETARAAIAAHIAALKKAGFVIVPRDPTDAMLHQGQWPITPGNEEETVEIAANVWRYMIDESLK